MLYLTGTQFPQAFGLAESWDPEALQTVGATTGYEARVWNAARRRTRRAAASASSCARRSSTSAATRAGGAPRNRTARIRTSPASWRRATSPGCTATIPNYLLAASTLKHWLGNNNETNRNTSSSNIDDRNLREYYGYPFEQAIRIGKAQGIMTAYNKIDGIPSSAVSPLLKSLVIGEWGFDGTLLHGRVGPAGAGRRASATTRTCPRRWPAIVKARDGAHPAGRGRSAPTVMTAVHAAA